MTSADEIRTEIDRAERKARQAIVAEAFSWLGTPYHHAADLKGVGVDCAMLLVRVFVDLDIIPRFDPRPYTRDWMLHRDDEKYQGFVLETTREVDPSTGSGPRPGDVMLLRVGRCFSHGGIVTRCAPLTIIHAYARARCVVEEEVARNAEIGRRPTKFFSHWGA